MVMNIQSLNLALRTVFTSTTNKLIIERITTKFEMIVFGLG